MLLKAVINIYCMCTVCQALRMMPHGPSPHGLKEGSCPRSWWDSCPEQKHGVATACGNVTSIPQVPFTVSQSPSGSPIWQGTFALRAPFIL